MKKLLYIARYPALAVLLLLLLALAPARAQNVVYQGETTQLGVEPQPNDTYKWELYRDSTKNFVTAVPDCPTSDAEFVGGNTGTPVNVLWKEPGIYIFKVTATDITGCTNNIAIGKMKVLPALPKAVLSPHDPICDGETASIEVILTGLAPWDITFTDGTDQWTVTGVTDPTYILRVHPSVPTWYWVSEISDKRGTNSVPSDKILLEVKPRPVSSPIYQYEP